MIKLVLVDKTKKVINPINNQRVSEDGIVLPKLDSYWNARIKDGDLEIFKETEKGKKWHLMK